MILISKNVLHVTALILNGQIFLHTVALWGQGWNWLRGRKGIVYHTTAHSVVIGVCAWAAKTELLPVSYASCHLDTTGFEMMIQVMWPMACPCYL